MQNCTSLISCSSAYNPILTSMPYLVYRMCMLHPHLLAPMPHRDLVSCLPCSRTADVAGDKICLFGFSRGAYTARALAGMLHKVGLLPPDNFQQIPFAYKMYCRTDAEGWTQSTGFKKAFCIDVDIEFIGVWLVASSTELWLVTERLRIGIRCAPWV